MGKNASHPEGKRRSKVRPGARTNHSLVPHKVSWNLSSQRVTCSDKSHREQTMDANEQNMEKKSDKDD